MLDQNKIEELRHATLAPRGHLIGGRVEAAENSATLEVLSPLDGRPLTTIAAGTKGDADRAVSAAKKAFDSGSWSRMAPASRKKILLKWANLIEANALEITALGVRDNGTEISMAIKAEVGSAVNTIRYYAEALDKIYGEIAPTPDDILGLVHHEPVGVVAAIVPWNFPLMIGTWKLAPALAAGNSVVLKPAETASLSLLQIAQLALEAGLPPGALNVVTGRGAEVGEALSQSMDVDVMAFTGSGPVGRRLLENSARSNLKRCYLELGGKSPNIVFDDAPDLRQAAKVSANGIFRNSGQVCVAASRLLVQQTIYDDFIQELAGHAALINVGDPLDIATEAGAVNSREQLEKNLGFAKTAQDQGGDLVLGGNRLHVETGGFFMAPTIIANVKPNDQLFQNEVFGPVLAITPFKDEADAIRLANHSPFGLASGVWTADLSRAHRMVRAVRAGVVHVNTYGGPDATVPLGGVKQSGNGHDKSLHAFHKYLDLKTAWIKL